MSDLPEDFIEQIRKIARTDPKLAEQIKSQIANNPDTIEGRAISGGDFRSIDLYTPVNPPSQSNDPVMSGGQGDGSGSLPKNRNKRGVNDYGDFGAKVPDLEYADENADPFDSKNKGKAFRALHGYEDIDTKDPIVVYLDGRYRKPYDWETEDLPPVYPDYEEGWSWQWQGYAGGSVKHRYNSKYQILLPVRDQSLGGIKVWVPWIRKQAWLSMHLERWSTQYDDDKNPPTLMSYTKEKVYEVDKNDNKYYSQREMLDSKTLAPYVFGIVLVSVVKDGVRVPLFNNFKDNFNILPSTLFNVYYSSGVEVEVDTSSIRTPQWPVGHVIYKKDEDLLKTGAPYTVSSAAIKSFSGRAWRVIITRLNELLYKLDNDEKLTRNDKIKINEELKSLYSIFATDYRVPKLVSLIGLIINFIAQDRNADIAINQALIMVASLFNIKNYDSLYVASKNTFNQQLADAQKKGHTPNKNQRNKAVNRLTALELAKRKAYIRKHEALTTDEMIARSDKDFLMTQKDIKWFDTEKGNQIRKIDRLNMKATTKEDEIRDPNAMWENKVGQIIEDNARFRTHLKDSIINQEDHKYNGKVVIRLRQTATNKIFTFEINGNDGVRVINNTGKKIDFDKMGRIV